MRLYYSKSRCVRETLESKDKSEEHKKQLRASIEKGNMKITL